MPQFILPLKDILTNPDYPVDLTALPPAEAARRIQDSFGFLSTAVDVTIDGDMATITLPEPKAHQAEKALDDLRRASRSAKRGRYDAAIALYRDCLAILPAHTEARRELAMALMETGQHKEAKRHLLQVMQLDPTDAWAHLLMGNLYLKAEHDLGSADRYLTAAADLDPDDSFTTNSLATLKAKRGQFDQAIHLYRRAIDLDPSFPNPYHGLALAHTNQGDDPAALSTLDGLFNRPVSDDPRHAPIYREARALYLEIRRRRAESTIDESMSRLRAILGDYSAQARHGVRIESDPSLKTSAKVELAWVHGSPDHIIRYADDRPATLPYLIAHEFEHIRLAEQARAVGRYRNFATTPHTLQNARRSIERDVKRISRRSGLDPNAYDGYLTDILTGLANQVYNAPLDFIIDTQVFTNYPFLLDSQFVWMSDEHRTNLRVLTDTDIRSLTPTKVLQANLAMNAASAVFLDALFAGATDIGSAYQSSGQLQTGHRLYDLWRSTQHQFHPGDEFDLVDSFAAELKLTDWYIWHDDEPAVPPSAPTPTVDTSLNSLFQDPAAQMAVTMYIVGALKRFAKLSREQVLQIAGEIALLGQTGIDYTSREQQYTLRFLPGEEFTGLHLLALMYTGFRQVEPTLETGIPLQDVYEQARRLYDLGKP